MKGQVLLTLFLFFGLLTAAQPKKQTVSDVKSVPTIPSGKQSTKKSRRASLAQFLSAKKATEFPASPPSARKLNKFGAMKPPGAPGGAGGAPGGQNNKISITPPPTPQAVLPPKPIIVAPLIVRQKRKANKIMVLRHGGLWGNPMMPAPYVPGFPMMNMPSPGRKLNRHLTPPPGTFAYPAIPAMYPGAPLPAVTPRELYNGQQIVFNNAHTQLNEEEQSLRVTSQDNGITVSKAKQTEYLENLRIQKGTEFKASLSSLEELQKLIDNTRESLVALRGAMETGTEKIGNEISQIETLDTKLKESNGKLF